MLDGLTVPVGANAAVGVALDGRGIGLVELAVMVDDPTVEEPVELVMLPRCELELSIAAPLEVL